MGFRLLLILLATFLAAGGVAIIVVAGGGDGASPAPSRLAAQFAPAAAPGAAKVARAGSQGPTSCAASAEMTEAGAVNAGTLTTAAWSVFGRPETGWEVYAPLVSREVGATCPPDAGAFATALRRWQSAHHLPADGRMSADTLRAMDLVWLSRRPFVAATKGGFCPPPPPAESLVAARPDEGYRGKVVRLHADALAAYRRLAAAAKSALPGIAAEPDVLTIVSGYRGPEEEAARCAIRGSCGTPSMARCSAHRTGFALDLFLGGSTDVAPTSSDDENRAAQSRSPAYRWLVANADRYGFTPYPFEPWHWEYVGSVARR